MMGAISDYLSTFDQPQQPKFVSRMADLLSQQEGAQNRKSSVMNSPQPSEWAYAHQLPNQRIGGDALEAPIVSPDDLIGTGIPSKLASLLMTGGKALVAKVGAGGLLGIGATRKVFHGTGALPFSEFMAGMRGSATGEIDAGLATFLADHPADARPYAEWAAEKTGEIPRVISAYMRTDNPLILGMDGSKGNTVNGPLLESLLADKAKAVEFANKRGHDSIYFPDGNDNDLPGTWMVFDNSKLKIKDQNAP